MNDWFNHAALQIDAIIQLGKQNLLLTFFLTAVFWLIHFLNWMLGHRLSYLGVYPRHAIGLRGILFSPFIHGHFDHLIFNTIPLFILINLTLMYGYTVFIFVTVVVIMVSGLAVWCLGRPGIHIGASGLIMGYWGFLLAQVYFHPNLTAILIGIVCLYYLSGLATSLLPSVAKSVSWEAHLFGCLSGVAASVYLAKVCTWSSIWRPSWTCLF